MKALVALALLSATALSNAALYDLTADFSILNGNPNGVWSYGMRPSLTGGRVNFTRTVANYVNRDWWEGRTVSQFYIPSVFKQNTAR